MIDVDIEAYADRSDDGVGISGKLRDAIFVWFRKTEECVCFLFEKGKDLVISTMFFCFTSDI